MRFRERKEIKEVLVLKKFTLRPLPLHIITLYSSLINSSIDGGDMVSTKNSGLNRGIRKMRKRISGDVVSCDTYHLTLFSLENSLQESVK